MSAVMPGRSVRTAILHLAAQREVVILGLLVAELALFALLSPNFASLLNIQTVLRNSTELGILAAGMTIVIIQGGIDISVGSVLGIVAFVAGTALIGGVPAIVVVLIALVVGAVLGLLNGLLVTVGRVPPIIATLGTMSLWRAVIFLLLGGQFLTGIPSLDLTIERGSMLAMPYSFVLVLVVYVVIWYVMRFRVIGRTIYAVGNNEEAARLAGLDVTRAKLFSYVTVGALAGLAGLTYTMRLHSVEITVGLDLALQAIAAVVIGGASITGGRGTVVGTLIGVLFVGFLRNGLVLLGVPSLWEQAALGFFILASASADHIMEVRRAARRLASTAGVA